MNACKRKLSYCQFMICLETFKQLNIIETENDCKITNLFMDKKDLNSSIFYKKLSAIKSMK